MTSLSRFITIAYIFWLIPSMVSAMEIRSYSDIPLRGDIVVYPAKFELEIEPGSRIIKNIDVLNRTGEDQLFNIETDDFAPEENSNQIVLGQTLSGLDSSLKKFIIASTSEFVLKHGQEAHVPVAINIPKDTKPGGLYGSVLVSAKPVKNSNGATNIVTRIGTLFFAKISGKVFQSGKLLHAEFIDNSFKITFKNDGDIYLNPYGIISVSDISSGRGIKKMVVDPWFVMPRSTRFRSISAALLAPGKYFAKVEINRGYNNIIDTEYLNFEVERSVPNLGIIVLSIAMIGLLLVFSYARRKL